MIDITPSVPRPDVIYEPDLVGRITEVTHDGITDTYTVTVAGESFDIAPDAVRLVGSPGSSNSFLIYGNEGGTEWYRMGPDDPVIGGWALPGAVHGLCLDMNGRVEQVFEGHGG